MTRIMSMCMESGLHIIRFAEVGIRIHFLVVPESILFHIITHFRRLIAQTIL
jgi:hypothetical protein